VYIIATIAAPRKFPFIIFLILLINTYIIYYKRKSIKITLKKYLKAIVSITHQKGHLLAILPKSGISPAPRLPAVRLDFWALVIGRV
jgi:hypothetical protein